MMYTCLLSQSLYGRKLQSYKICWVSRANSSTVGRGGGGGGGGGGGSASCCPSSAAGCAVCTEAVLDKTTPCARMCVRFADFKTPQLSRSKYWQSSSKQKQKVSETSITSSLIMDRPSSDV